MSKIAPPQGLCSSPRGNSPLSTVSERQKVATGQSTTSFQGAYNEQPGTTASTASFPQRRSSLLAMQTFPDQIPHLASPLCHGTSQDDNPEPSPAPNHPTYHQGIDHRLTSQQDHSRSRSQSGPVQHRADQMAPALGFAQPVPRTARPHSISLNAFRMTPELIAKIDQTHSMDTGMSGVAYAGGAISGPVSRSTRPKSTSLLKESSLELARSGKRPSLCESGEGLAEVQRRNTTSCNKDRETSELHRHSRVKNDPPQRISVQQPSPKLEVQRTDSPKYFASLSDCGDPTSYKSGDRELLPAQVAAPSPSSFAPRQNVPYTVPLRSAPRSVARVPDKSLPIQEESEEDDAFGRNDNQKQRRDHRGEDKRPAHRREQEVRDPRSQQDAASPPTSSSDPIAASYRSFPHSPTSPHSRSGAPTPPTPHNHATASSPSPSPLILGMGRANSTKVLQPSSLVPRVDSPYPYTFGHIPPSSFAGPSNKTSRLSQMDPNVIRNQRVSQLQADELNNGGMVSDSTLTPSLTPLPGLQYNPSALLHMSKALTGRHDGIADSQTSTRSSPSHEPVPLPPFSGGYRGRPRRERSRDLRRQSKTRPPRRIESTEPRDTSPELLSGEEAPGESREGVRHHSAHRPARWDESADDEDNADADDGEWIDEDVGVEGAADDLLQLEFDPDYINDPKKRRRSWELRWEALLRDFHTLGRETNTTLVLLAAPTHTGKLHSVASRAVHRDRTLKSIDMKNIRSAFAEMASRHHALRPPSLVQQLSPAGLSSYDRSPSSSDGADEEDLRRAVDTTIDTLCALKSRLYERREMR